MIKAVVFDLDHTLFDRYETLRIVGKKLRAAFSINPAFSDEDIIDTMIYADCNYVHFGWDRLQEYLCNETKLFGVKPKYDEYRKFVMGEFMNVAVKFPFTKPMLKELRDMGLKLGLITNGSSELQRRKLELLDIADCFDEIYVGGEHPFQKPSVEPFSTMSKWLKTHPCEMLYVGDNPLNDIDASRKAGYIPVFVNTVGKWVLPEIKKPQHLVETVEEIPSLVKKLI